MHNLYIKSTICVIMDKEEIAHVLTAILVFTVVLSVGNLLDGNYNYLGVAFASSVVIISASIAGKKFMAHLLDSDVSHRIWFSNRFGPNLLSRPFPSGIVFPLLLSLVTFGFVKMGSILEYETSAKKIRAAKRFGYYSYAEMTDWHNALIGTAGMIVTLIVMVASYLLDFEPTAKAAALFMFWNMIPMANLDGTQIFFGSKTLWTIMGLLALLSALYTVILI